jgi:hypothetical protein
MHCKSHFFWSVHVPTRRALISERL